jgi:hypothetical protein
VNAWFIHLCPILCLQYQNSTWACRLAENTSERENSAIQLRLSDQTVSLSLKYIFV